MTRFAVCALVLVLSCAVSSAGKLQNASFETDFGERQDLNMWGEYGEAWGEAYQVLAGTRSYVKKARDGNRVLVINVPTGSWNGIWQQVPWSENTPFLVKGYYMITGGDLPASCATFLKVEFYDGNDQLVGVAEGEKRRVDTKGKWEADQLQGMTPAGTSAIRFIAIAGDGAGGENIVDRIFWDDMDASE